MPREKKRSHQPSDRIQTILSAMQEKKAERIVWMDLSEIRGASWETFLICHAQSTSQVEAIAEEVCRVLKTEWHEKPLHKEGYSNSEWILLDFGTIVVHIFQTEIRELYQLENLWADATIEFIEDELVKPAKKINERITKPRASKKTLTEPKPTPKKRQAKD